MSINWYAGYGGYNNTGNFYNVLLLGSPNNNIKGLSNVSLDKAHADGYGYGVGFEQIEDEKVKIYINLVGVAVSDTGRLIYNNTYVQFNGRYNYYVKISISQDNAKTFKTVFQQKQVSHASNQPLAYLSGWQQSTFKTTYDIIFTKLTTHVKFEIYGEDATFPYQNIFTRQQIIKNFKPYAIRKNNDFKSLNRPNGFFKIRKNNNWVNVSEMPLDEVGVINKGLHRIRKQNNFKGQSQIGNLK